MNKIINWTLGSFFRTLGRIFVYILIGFLLSMILSEKNIKLPNLFSFLDVHANTIKTDGWIYNMSRIEGSQWFNWTSSSNNSEMSISWGSKSIDFLTDDDTGTVYMNNLDYAYKDSINFGSNGVSIGVQTGTYFYRTKLYHATIYVASTMPLSRYSTTSMTFGNVNGNNEYASVFLLEVSCSYFNPQYSYCYAVNGIVQSQRSGNFIYARLTSSTSGNVAVLGYTSEYLGVIDQPTNSSIESIVANSGFATSTSVSQVQSSVNQVQQELEGTQDAIDNQTQQQQENHEETMNTITDNSSDGAQSDASSFFSNFNTNNHGLTGIITAPLNAINSLTNKTCSPLTIPLPFVNENLTLPCMRPIYENFFGGFMTLYDIITLGIVSYWIMVRIFGLVKDFKNPEHDEIEVVDL